MGGVMRKEMGRRCIGGSVGVDSNGSSTKSRRKYKRDTKYKTNSLKCIYTNATSLVNKWNEFKATISAFDPDIIAVTETWFNQTSPVKLDGYEHYLLNRVEARGGGVIIYIKVCYESYEVKLTEAVDLEHVWCALRIESYRLLVGCIYRPPWSDRKVNISINEAISAASKLSNEGKYDNVLIMGDFNYSDIIWSNDGGSFRGKGRQSSIEFVEAINNSYLNQFVLEPTFGNKILDLIIASDPICIFNVQNGPPIGYSDRNALHSTLRWDLLVPIAASRASKIGKFDFKRANVEGLKKDFQEIDWSVIRDEDLDMDSCMKVFAENYWAVVTRNVPYTFRGEHSELRARPKWFSSGIKTAIAQKYKVFARLIAASARNEKSIRVEYNKQCRLVKKLVKRARREYEMKIASESKSNPKLVYSYINNQLKNKSGIKSLVGKDGIELRGIEEITECLNNEFLEAFTKDDGQTEPNTSLMHKSIKIVSKMSIDPETAFNQDAVKIRLESLDLYKAPGVDGISPFVLNKCSDVLSYPLSLMYIKSFKTGMVPSAWKSANVSPIFKKGVKSCPSNYRPVSLTSILCRVKERILRDEMVRYLITNKLISQDQHGFVPAKSCITNLIETMDIVTEALNRGFFVILILLDFSRAFDTVCHRFLIAKLEAYGFDAAIVNWIRNFLSNRKQRVVMGTAYSEWVEVASGVPQGSVLGPLLFVIFINDMPQLTNHFCKLYADDSKLIGVVKNSKDIELLQADLDVLVEWANQWGMRFNIDKCKVMEIQSNKFNKINIDYTLSMISDGSRVNLTKTEREKDLGVTLNRKLKFCDHIDQAILKGNKVLGMLRKAFKYWNKWMFRKLYGSFIRPHLEYGAAVWNPHQKKDVKKLEKVQRRATKLVPEVRSLPYEDRLGALNIQSLEDRRKRGDLIQYFKFYKGFNKIKWFHSNIPMASLSTDGPARSIRGTSHRVTKQLSKIDARDSFLSNRIVNDWNSLPNEIVNSKSVNQFKNRLDEFMKQKVETKVYS
jgi:hypothetical protein